MIFVFRKIIYDSKLIHAYLPDSEDLVKDLKVQTFARDSFSAVLTSEYADYNYLYVPEHNRYFYIDVKSYQGNNINVSFTCDYGRTYAPEISHDFYITESELNGTCLAKLPSGEHIMNGENILYFPDKDSVRYLNHDDVQNVLNLLKSGIVVNYDDYEPDSFVVSVTPDTPDTPE